jgi:hypothetical protein
MRRAIIIAAVLAAGAAGAFDASPLVQFVTAQSFSPLSLGPVAWYKMDGNALDSSGNNYTGTVINASFTNGLLGQAVAIGTSESRVTSPVGAVLATNAGTICMWVKPNWAYAGADQHYFWDTYGGNNARFIFFKNNVGVTDLRTATTARGTAAIAWPQSVWTHVTVVWGDNLCYTNGVLANNFTDGGLGLGASTLYIGDRYTTASLAFDGAIDDVLIFNRALTQSEITQLYNWRQ